MDESWDKQNMLLFPSNGFSVHPLFRAQLNLHPSAAERGNRDPGKTLGRFVLLRIPRFGLQAPASLFHASTIHVQDTSESTGFPSVIVHMEPAA